MEVRRVFYSNINPFYSSLPEDIQRYREGQSKTIQKLALSCPVEKFVRLNEIDWLWNIKNRSAFAKRSEFGERLCFEGSRLVIEKDLDKLNPPVLQYHLPFLRELRTEVEFVSFPRVKKLALTLPELSSKVLQKIPDSVEALHIFIEDRPTNVSDLEFLDPIFTTRPLPRLKALSITTLHIDKVRLVCYAKRNLLVYIQIFCDSKSRDIWAGFLRRQKRVFASPVLDLLSNERQTLVYRMMAIERNLQLRNLCSIFKNELLIGSPCEW